MQIESFEPFHIGSKFIYYVDKAHLLNKLYEYYEKNKEEGFILNTDIIKGDQTYLPIFNILINSQEKLTVQMNLSSNALNVVGSEPEKVKKLFLKLIENLPDLGFEIESTFAFYEIITSIIILLEDNDKTPNEIFGKFSSNIFKDMEDIPNLIVNHIRFSNEIISKETDERFNLELLPNPTSPNKRIILKILKRVKNYEDLIQFQEKLEDIIDKLYLKLVK